MKLLVLALTVALLFAASEALRCHHCVPKQAGGGCTLRTETCEARRDACASAQFLVKPYGHFQRCMALTDCEMLKINAYINVKCCTEDMCNTPVV